MPYTYIYYTLYFWNHFLKSIIVKFFIYHYNLENYLLNLYPLFLSFIIIIICLCIFIFLDKLFIQIKIFSKFLMLFINYTQKSIAILFIRIKSYYIL